MIKTRPSVFVNQENTKDILTNVVKALEESKDYTFHWADIAFLYRWWQDQDSSTRESVKKLVADERFIFINGGWVINDEALPSYKETIAQMRLGLDFLKRTFNVRPHIGWQIDPFGSTALTASVFHKLGFSAFIENRISNDFKDILEKKEGYNFCWQGHQVDEFKQEDRILAHILQFFYTVPETRLDRGFIDINKKSYSSKFWDQKIQKVINELKTISDDSLKEYHVMVPAGDDFAFQQASEVFHAFDDLKKYLKKKGKSKGYNVEIKYSNIYKYFEDLKAMELDFGVFKGDFMPYQETWPNWNWNDFWTGYYSTRLHMKRWIRHTFNNLESTKALLTIKALQANNGSVNFNSNTEVGIEMINNIINEAEQRWAIMMHHDAITGTHTKITEQDYYNLLKESNDYLSRAYKIINQVFEVEAERSVHEILSNATEKLGSQKFDHYTVVNPTADARSEVINITLSSSLGEKDMYSVFVDTISLNKTSEFKNVQGAYADMQDMDTMSHQTQTVRKLFVHVELPAFSDIHLYIIPCSTEKSQCESSGYRLSTKIEPSIKVQDLTIKNNAIKLEIGSDGRLRSIENLTNNMKSGVTERFTAFSTRSTRSGFYLYNPRSERITIDTGNVKMWHYELPNLKCIIQVEHDANNTRFLKTYSIDHVGLKENLEQFFLEIH